MAAFISNGMGGYDWSGLPYAVELFGITDMEGLMHRLFILKTYQPPKGAGD